SPDLLSHLLMGSSFRPETHTHTHTHTHNDTVTKLNTPPQLAQREQITSGASCLHTHTHTHTPGQASEGKMYKRGCCYHGVCVCVCVCVRLCACVCVGGCL